MIWGPVENEPAFTSERKPLSAQRLFRLFLGKIQMPKMKTKNAGTVWWASGFPLILQDKVTGEVKEYCIHGCSTHTAWNHTFHDFQSLEKANPLGN